MAVRTRHWPQAEHNARVRCGAPAHRVLYQLAQYARALRVAAQDFPQPRAEVHALAPAFSNIHRAFTACLGQRSAPLPVLHSV